MRLYSLPFITAVSGFLLFTLALLSNEERPLQFWDVESGSWKQESEILPLIASYDVVIWGEEHDDKNGHRAQLAFLEKLSEQYDISLSLEMLERDQKRIVSEYLGGKIPEKQFLSGSVFWNNFKEDYFPLVRLAKEKKLPVVCANPPRRYVNAIARKGISAYQDFDETVLNWMPRAYTLSQMEDPDYKEKLLGLFQSPHHGKPGSDSMLLAQYVWDQGMAESISQELYSNRRKVFHINGRFHSDFGGGVAYRLRTMGHRVLVISAFSGELPDSLISKKIADLVFLTNDR